MAGETSLSIEGLKKVYRVDNVPASVLEGVDFQVNKGELVCILGRSGCGKSTLLNILAGFIPPSSGTVLLDGKPVTRPGPDRCVVFQEDTLFPWLTVKENIAFGLKGLIGDRRVRGREVSRFLSLVGLSEFGNYLPREISGGMRQRVALARVLILKPRILLMDEPFASLDAQTRQEMQNMLLDLWGKLSHTIIFVTHDVTEAVILADRILLMGKNPGRIREEIRVSRPRPRTREDAELMRCSSRLFELLRE